jgi:spermidine/putrescine transport system substrate-binding protein
MSDRSGDRTDGTVDRAATSGDAATMSRRSYLAAAGAASTALGAGCLGGGGAGAGGSTTINIITWEEFEEMESNIEDTLDIDIEITPSTSSTEMFSQWNSGQDEQFDIAVPNNNLVPRFMDADLVAPMPEDVVDNFDSLYDKFQQFVDEQFTAGGDSYGVPIRFGWYGYAYDTREVPEHDPSYDIMFDEDYVDADLDGEIIMYDEAAKTIPVAALYLGHEDALTESDVMDFSEGQLNEIRDTLIEQKSRLQGYISSDPTFIQEFQQGNFLVGHSGRNEVVETWTQGDDWAEFVVPQEGAMAWYETAVVSAASDNQEAAWEVINEFVAPENGAALARAGYSPSCNPAVAEELDSDENDLFGSVDPERLDGMIPFKDIASDVQDTYESTWEEVKSA